MKKKLELDEAAAKRLYPTASPEFKELLEANFDKKVLSPNIEDRILTFTDVCFELGNTHPLVTQLQVLSDNDFPLHILAAHQITMIAEVFNEGVVMNVLDTNQKKWYPWFEVKGSGLHFYCSDYHFGRSRVPSQLCFKSEHLSNLAAERFVNIYKELLS